MKDFMNQFGAGADNNDDFGGRDRRRHGRRGGHHPQGGSGGRGEGFEGPRGEGFDGGFGGRDFGGRGFGGHEGHGFEGHGFEGRGHEGRGFDGRGGRGRGRGGFGGPEGPMGGFDLGPMGEGRGPRGGRGGRRGPGRGRKGDVRNAVLALLAEQQLNGYGLINAIAEKSNGLWRPSAGSIYPALGLLEDEGLIEATEAEGKKVYTLSEAGKRYAGEHAEELDEPWARVAEPHRGFLDVRGDMHQLGMAVQQVVVTGDEQQLEAARKILERARKDVYRLLAGEGTEA